MKSAFSTLYSHVYNLKIIIYYIILTSEKQTYIFYTTEIYQLTVISCQKIASSPTNINGVYKYELIFLFEDHFSKSTYFIKSQDIACVLKFVILCFSVLLVPYIITFHPYQSLKICNHCCLEILREFDIFFWQLPRI